MTREPSYLVHTFAKQVQLRVMRLLFVLFLLFTTAVVSLATDPDSVKVVTGPPGTSIASDLLKPVLVIGRDEIRRSNASNVAELLKYQLNFDEVYLGRNGYDVLYLGGDRKSVKVLMDGVPLFSNSHDRVDFSTIPVYNIERIEILKGSSSTYFGTDAVTAVINIITLNLDQDYTDGMVGFHSSSPGNTDVKGKFQLNSARHRIELGGSRSYFEGLNGIDSGRVKQWKPLVNYQLKGGYAYTLMPGLEAFAQVDHFHQVVQDRQYPITKTSRAIDYDLHTDRSLFVAGIKGQLSKYHHFRFDQSFSTFKQRDIAYMRQLTDLEQRKVTLNNPGDSLIYHQYRTSMVLAKNRENKLAYMMGLEFVHQVDRVIGTRNAIKSSITEMSFFGGATYYPSPRATLNGSARLNGSSKFRTPLSYDGNFKYKMTEDANIYISYSRSYRIPSWNELFYQYDRPDINIKGNLNLRSETMNTFYGRFDVDGGRIDFKFSLFFLNTNNGIELVQKQQDGNVYQFVNTRHFKSVGNLVKVTGDFKYTDFQVGISNTGVNRYPEQIGNYNFTLELIGNIQQKIPGTPVEIWMFNKLVSARTDIIEDSDGVFEEQQVDGYILSDLGISYHMPAPDVIFSLGCKNIMNTMNTSGLYLPVERLNDEQVNRRVPISLDYGRRWWFSIEVAL